MLIMECEGADLRRKKSKQTTKQAKNTSLLRKKVLDVIVFSN